MRYEVISADSHLDLVWLPEALVVSEAPSRLNPNPPKEGRRVSVLRHQEGAPAHLG